MKRSRANYTRLVRSMTKTRRSCKLALTMLIVVNQLSKQNT